MYPRPMPKPQLHHDVVTGDAAPDGGDTFLVLHGIFGSGRNWASVARRIVTERAAWRGALVDLREHGRSQSFEPPHTVEAAARDLLGLARETELNVRAVVGHSFGGKVALEFVRIAWEEGEALPAQIWVVDSTPEASDPGGSAWEMLRHLRQNPGPFPSRQIAVSALEQEGVEPSVAAWMATNLDEGLDGAWRWRIDVDAMEELLRDFFRRDLWDVVEEPPDGIELHLIRATGSTVFDDAALRRVQSAAEAQSRLRLHEIEGGHWLNADNPDAIVDLLVEHLD